MLFRKLVVVGLVGFVSFAANIATAEDAVAPNTSFAVDGISFSDPDNAFQQDRFSIDVGFGEANRFGNLGQGGAKIADNRRDLEVSLIARDVRGFDVAFAERRGYGFNDEGDVTRETRASELRLGNGLGVERDQPSQVGRWYVFAASEDEALVWQPGTRSEFGGAGNSFSLQDRVEVGDLQAGITYELNGFQTSLAYVERETYTQVGMQGFSREENFTGVTLTYRH
jgi:hypothetical protein